LLEVSAKAQERARLHDECYALITAQNAACSSGTGPLEGQGGVFEIVSIACLLSSSSFR